MGNLYYGILTIVLCAGFCFFSWKYMRKEQYRVAPEGTRNRLVQETLRDVLSKVRVIQAATDASLEIFVEP